MDTVRILETNETRWANAPAPNNVYGYNEPDNEQFMIIHVPEDGSEAAAIMWSDNDPFWQVFKYFNKVRSEIDNIYKDENHDGEIVYSSPEIEIPNIDYLDREECIRDVRSIIYNTRKALDELESFVNMVAPKK
ncbi:hypothetical protein MHH28_11340 [Paenibacillus sp. FSL K6-1217]|uniref:hypothetical protein n=1 Tax=Paenibacillus sp. FSL K6-1217 TaxID=2921466 RepID=UPI00324A994B